jgi:hypothetical protein
VGRAGRGGGNPKSEIRSPKEGRSPKSEYASSVSSHVERVGAPDDSRKLRWGRRVYSHVPRREPSSFRSSFRSGMCHPTPICREAPMPLLTELEHHPLGQPGYRNRAPSGAVRHCSRVRGVQAKGRLKAVHGGRYLRGSWSAARRVENRSAPITACGACYFGIRISAFFRISGFGFRICETNSSCEGEQSNPSYGAFRRTVSRCAQSGFGSG